MASNFRINGRKNDSRINGHNNGANSIGRYIVRNGNLHANHNHPNSHQQPYKKQKFSSSPAQQSLQQNQQQQNQLHQQNGDQLPVVSYKGAFFKLLNENQSMLVIGETGSGKTTQIPQWCLDYCVRKTKQSCVACTQPRRIAAMSIAERVAAEMRVPLGNEVGYSVRFESKTSDKTRLKYLTDGMLLREAMLDDKLKDYGIIILDEAHERTLQTEILFGVIKKAFIARNNCTDKSLLPLKVVIMSATINVKLFKKYFDSHILSIQGRQHPVQDLYTEVPQSDLLIATLTCVFQVHRTSDEGDILVFCSGQDEIQTMITLTKRTLKQAPVTLQNLTPFPLYASLPADKQMKVFQHKPRATKTNGFTNGHTKETSNDTSESDNSPQDRSSTFERRVIFATNVAETSVTIPNIKFVIDTGKVKCRYYCPKTGLESLKVTNISKAQAKQRAGRAGRIAPGTCYHLYTNDDYLKLVDCLPPEIKRCNLDGVVMQMISIGVKNLSSFDFLERPDESRLKAALINLLNLKAIKPTHPESDESQDDKAVTTPSQGNESSAKRKNAPVNLVTDDNLILNLSYDLTALGKKLCIFPLDPAMSRIILAAHELRCLDEALTIVSLLSVENMFYIPPNKNDQAEKVLSKFYSNEGDVITLLNVYRAFKRTLRLNKTGTKVWCVEHFIHLKNLRMARLIRSQLSDLCKSLDMDPSTCGQDTSVVRKALAFGLFNNVATMFDGHYRNKSGAEVHIHPRSCLFKAKPECILYVEVVETNKCYMRNCTLVDINWVREVSSEMRRQQSPTQSIN